MKKLMMGAVVAVSMALTGCGNVCSDIEDASETFEKKYQPCATAGEEPTSFNVNQCEDNLDKCSDSEKEALADFADCLRELPECTPATEQNFGTATAACVLGLSGKVGESCLTALGGN